MQSRRASPRIPYDEAVCLTRVDGNGRLYGRGMDLEILRSMCDTAAGGLVPDRTIVLDVPVSVSRDRLRVRPGHVDRMESEDDAFHIRVRDGFLALAQTHSRYRVLDGTRAPEELVADALSDILNYAS